MASDSCGICGGDGRITNSFGGSSKTCPACHGSGRRSEDNGFRDVTKTKPSHHKQTNTAGPSGTAKPNWPSTYEGGQLANEVQACASVSSEIKLRLTREIVEYEASHGKCTQTFIKKIRKQVKPAVG